MNKEEFKSKINKFVNSRNFKTAIYVLVTIFILSFVFQAGMMAGYRKASFNRNWGNNYEKNFGPMHMGERFIDEGFGKAPSANGAIGKIIKVEFPNIVVLDKDQTEKIIVIKEDTSILEKREKVTKDSLLLDKFIVVIGSPNESGQIEAKLIRILPSPDEMMKGVMQSVDQELPVMFENKKI